MENPAISFEILKGPDSFSKIEHGWENLCELLDDDLSVFATFTWYKNWWKYYGADRDLHLFTMWQGENLIGLAPLMWRRASFHGLPVRMIGFMENNQSLHNDFIVSPEFRTIFLQKMIQLLFDQSSRWDILFLRNISTLSSNLCPLMEHLNKQGMKWEFSRTIYNSPYLIPSGTWADYLAGRSNRTRRNLRNIKNRMHRAGAVSVKNIRTWEEFVLYKEDIFEVAQKSWSEKDGDSLGSPLNRDFFESLAYDAAAKGWLSIWTLHLDEKMIAVEFHLKAYGKEHAMRGHYHPDFGSLSPGTYLEMMILENVFDTSEKPEIYDLCGCFENYKRKWTETSVQHGDLFIFKDRAYSNFVHFNKFRVVPFMRKVLGLPNSGAFKDR
jgi:CelD/BcsL family acetyltransferase involved in cellulose biosynthesis